MTDERLSYGNDFCKECGQEIDTDWCHCGDSINHRFDNHSGIPMGCICGYSNQDDARIAKNLRERWHEERIVTTRLRAELAAKEAECARLRTACQELTDWDYCCGMCSGPAREHEQNCPMRIAYDALNPEAAE